MSATSLNPLCSTVRSGVVNDRWSPFLVRVFRHGARRISTRAIVSTLLSWLVIAAASAPAFAQLPLPTPTPTPPPPPPPNLSNLDPLLQPLASSLNGHSRVIVRATSATTVGTVALAIQTAGGTLGRQLPILDAMVAD